MSNMLTKSNSSLKSLLKFANFYTFNTRNIQHECKILVVGGGTGGCSMAARFASEHNVIIVEPSDTHYYQPLFTLIGAGISTLDEAKRPMKSVLPKKAQWIQDSVASFDPNSNQVTLTNKDVITYEIMIVAMGLSLYWNQVEGLEEAVRNPESQVCSIYSPDTVMDVFPKIERTKKGTAYFTFPNTPVKCPGAPQKIAYLAEEYWSNKNLRNEIDVVYNTTLPNIFGVKKYADALWAVCKQRNITVNLRTNLVHIDSAKNEATFQNLDNTDHIEIVKFSLLHVSPPMGPPLVLKNATQLVNEAGFLKVCPKSLRHINFNNIYGLGDCTSTPNSKTMAAIAAQTKVLFSVIESHLKGTKSEAEYDGYASCPLITGKKKCILAEFDYNMKPKETFPVDQKKEMYIMYLMKKHAFPFVYWNLMLKGYWHGPEVMRKLMHPNMPKTVS